MTDEDLLGEEFGFDVASARLVLGQCRETGYAVVRLEGCVVTDGVARPLPEAFEHFVFATAESWGDFRTACDRAAEEYLNRWEATPGFRVSLQMIGREEWRPFRL